MDPLFRQRLVGTLVLVALGIVFWPLIFVTPETREPIALQPMSQRPAVDQTPIPEPDSFEPSVAPKLPDRPKTPSQVQDAADIQTQTDAAADSLADLPDSDSVAAPQPRLAPPSEDPQSLMIRGWRSFMFCKSRRWGARLALMSLWRVCRRGVTRRSRVVMSEWMMSCFAYRLDRMLSERR